MYFIILMYFIEVAYSISIRYNKPILPVLFLFLHFSPNGELLASVGKEPDYNITIWNWRRHKILLRTSAFTFDVNTVVFSPYCPGQLTTAGNLLNIFTYSKLSNSINISNIKVPISLKLIIHTYLIYLFIEL